MNHFCHLCGKLVDLIGLQPEGVNLCDCKTRASRDNRRLSDKGYLDPLTEISLLKEEIAALREANEIDLGEKVPLLTEIVVLRAEIAALREQIKALEGLISGAIQHSWTPDDYEKFWLAAGKEKP